MDSPDEHITQFADILLPVPIPILFTYRVPVALNKIVAPLLRVIVPFGPKKILTGIITKLHQHPPKDYEVKSILEVLDSYPLLFDQQLILIKWMASYYMCAQGEVLNAALPSGLKLSSESLVQLNPAFDFDNSGQEFSEKEWTLLYRLKHDTLTYSEISKFLGVKSLYAILKSLTTKDAIIIIEEVKEKFHPKKEKRIRFTKNYNSKSKLELLFKELISKPKHEEVLLEILNHLPVFTDASVNMVGIPKSVLINHGISVNVIKTLIRNGVIEEFEIILSRFPEGEKKIEHLPTLSPKQVEVNNGILGLFEKNLPVLLFGITGSGKTEIYIHLIQKVMESGTQALFLLPEIALTTQIVTRLKKIFGNEMGIYHSRFSDNERVEVWNGIVEGKIKFVVGVRSSVFLPFDNLGLIIVDEEHDSSYKQDRAPRYNARDTALMLAKIHHAKIILGSGTPSVESYFHVKQGNFGMVELNERYGNSQTPDIKLSNTAEERKLKKLKGSFSSSMLKAIENSLKQNEQIMLFQNRRGYSPFMECGDCAHVMKCTNCSVSLTYHQFKNSLICHYCGYRESVPKSCPSCNSKVMLTIGLGTEKLEEEVKLNFPDVPVQRMDIDTTRTKSGHENILQDFGEGKTKILVGTQMITKGLDFDHVGLVGVFDTDRLMHFPDFRSFERAFQLILQVSGRAGRREKKGVVIVQTNDPKHFLFDYVLNQNIKGFIENQLHDRNHNLYPPYSRLIEISFKQVDKKISLDGATWFAGYARKAILGVKILGPGEPSVSKIRNEYIHTVLIKIPRNQGKLAEIKLKLFHIEDLLRADKNFKNIRVIFDVDPA